jgi:hypothetical protein
MTGRRADFVTQLSENYATWLHHNQSKVAYFPASMQPIVRKQMFVVRFCYHRTIPMMIFAAYYVFHYWLQLELAAYNVLIFKNSWLQFAETCSGLNLSWWLGTAGLILRPVRMPLWGPGPGPISLVLQKHPIRGVWAEARIYSAWFCSNFVER